MERSSRDVRSAESRRSGAAERAAATAKQQQQQQQQPHEPEHDDASSNQRHQESHTRPLSARDSTRRRAVEEVPATVCEAGGVAPHSAATAPAVVVLRRCDGPRVRTSGFQRIEEQAQRLRPADLRPRHAQQQQQH